jgi:hypothetical protein
VSGRARARHVPAPASITPQTFALEAPVEIRISPTATGWTRATYHNRAAYMPGWHWARTEAGPDGVAQLVCVHDGRIRPPIGAAS